MVDNAQAEFYSWNNHAKIEKIKSSKRWIDVRNYRKEYTHESHHDLFAKITYELWLVECQNTEV